MSVSGMSKRYNQLRSAIDELYAKVARGLFPGGPSHLFVNVVSAFGVDNTGATDAWPKLLTAIAVLAATGQIAWMPDGIYKCATAPTYNQIPNNARLWMSSGVTINSVLPFVDGHTSTPFYRDGWAHRTTITTLASNVVQGTPTLAVVSAVGLAIGQDIVLSSPDGPGEMESGYTIENIVGTTVTVDRAVLKPFPTGTTVYVSPGFPRNIQIWGNGAKMTGTADRWVQFVGARDCNISGFHLTGVTINQIVCSYDYGSLRSVFDSMVIDTLGGANTFLWGLAIEDGEASRIFNSSVTGGSFGFVLNECNECAVWGCVADGTAQAGFYSTYEGSGAVGNVGGGFFRCTAINCATNGFQGEFAQGVWWVECTALYCGGQGISFFNQSSDMRIRGFKAIGNGGYGVKLGSGVGYSASLVDVDTQNNGGGAGVYVDMDTSITRLDTSEPGPGIAIDQASVVLSVVNWRHNGNVNGFAAALTCSSSGCTLTLDQVRVETMAGTGTKFGLEITGASTVNVDHYVCAPAIYCGVYIDNSAQCRIGDSVDVSATTNGFVNNGTAAPAYNFGTVALNGAAGVAVAFANVTARDQLQLTRKTAGGTPGAAPTWTITPGTGATVTGTALDTSTYAYKFVTGA